MKLSESKEDYLEAVYLLEQQYGYVRNAMLCDYMGFSRSSISIAMRELAEQGYVIHNKYNGISLSDEGKMVAEKVYAKHVLLRDYLEAIGISPEQAEKDACRMEHVVSEETLQCLRERMEEMCQKKEDLA